MAALIAWQNWIDDAATEVTATDEAGELGVANLRSASVSHIWRSRSLTTGGVVRLRVDLGSVRDGLRVVALASPRDSLLLSATTTHRFVASAIAVDGEEVYNSGQLFGVTHAATGLWVHILPAAISARFIQWRISASSTDPYWQVGRLWAGPCMLTERGIAPDWRRTRADTGASTRGAVTGSRFGSHGARVRRPAFTVPALTAAEAAELRTMAFAVGTSGQCLVAPFADASVSAYAALGTLASAPVPAMRPDALNRYTATFEVIEEV